MVDFSANDGYFKIEKSSSFSKQIIKELGLKNDEVKKLGISVWQEIFNIAEKENMKNLNNTLIGEVFKFSESGWKSVVDIVSKKLNREITIDKPEPEKPAKLTRPQHQFEEIAPVIDSFEAYSRQTPFPQNIPVEYETQTIVNGEMFEEAGVERAEQRRAIGANGEILFISDTTYYYKNGKVVLETIDNSKVTREIIHEGTSEESHDQKKLYEAVPIKINLPADANKNAKEFAKALESKKAELMELLNLDNDTYNELALLAMGIAEQESDFGEAKFTSGYAKYEAERAISGFFNLIGVDHNTGGLMGKLYRKAAPATYGLGQINFEHLLADVPEICKKYNINSTEDLYNPAKAAVAMLAVLVKKKQIFENSSALQNGFKASQDAIISTNNETIVNEVSQNDSLIYLYKGASRYIKNGDITPELNSYAQNIKGYLKKYSVTEYPEDRLAAENKAFYKEQVKTYTAPPLNGNLGGVTFNQGPHKSNAQIFINAINANPNIKQDSKNHVIRLIQSGKIGFSYKLTANELTNLTQSDVDLLIKYAESGDENASQEFLKEYLESKVPEIPMDFVDSKNIVQLEGSRLLPTQFAGNIKDQSVSCTDPANPTPSEVLALTAQQVASERACGGFCFTYWRRAMMLSGIDAAMSPMMADYMVENNGKYQFEGKEVQYGDKDFKKSDKTNYYLDAGKPRHVERWFKSHPEMFEEVRFVDKGDGFARGITAADLPNLPAGYIVIYTPGEGFDDEPGHICITGGNGLGYSDETDNLAWGAHKSGKGEHGTFKIYRLSDNWEVTSDGQLKLKS